MDKKLKVECFRLMNDIFFLKGVKYSALRPSYNLSHSVKRWYCHGLGMDGVSASGQLTSLKETFLKTLIFKT